MTSATLIEKTDAAKSQRGVRLYSAIYENRLFAIKECCLNQVANCGICHALRCVVLLLTMVFPLVSWCGEYENGIESFKVDDVGVMFGKSLLPRLQTKRNVLYYVVTARSWASNKSILQVSIDEVGAVAIIRLFPNGKMKELNPQDFPLFADAVAFVSLDNKGYLYIPGSSEKVRETPQFVKGKSLRAYLLSDFELVVKSLGLKVPENCVTVRFRFCNGLKIIDLGTSSLDDCIDENVIIEKMRPQLQLRSDNAWSIAHKKRLQRKPRVVFGNVARIVKDHKGSFTIPYEAPPITATSRWQEVVYEYHSENYGDHWEEWSIPVGTIEHEKVKTLTRMYDYNALRKEAELFEQEMEEEKNAEPPAISDDDLQYELQKGVLLLGCGKHIVKGDISKYHEVATKTQRDKKMRGCAAVRNLPEAFFEIHLGRKISDACFTKLRTGEMETLSNGVSLVYFEPAKKFLEFQRYSVFKPRGCEFINTMTASKDCRNCSEAKTLYYAARYDVEKRFNAKMVEVDGDCISGCSLMLYDKEDPTYGIEIKLYYQNVPGKYWAMMVITRM